MSTKVYIECTVCGFKGVTYEDEEEELELEGETEECPRCGEAAKEVDDEEVIMQIDSKIEDNDKQRVRRNTNGVIPFTLGDDDE